MDERFTELHQLPLSPHHPHALIVRWLYLLKPQAEAFVRGLWEVIDPQWLQMFSEPELQVLISGSNKTLDVEDLKRHTRQAYWLVGFPQAVGRVFCCPHPPVRIIACSLKITKKCEVRPPNKMGICWLSIRFQQ